MFCGFSCGLAIGGLASAWLIPQFGWPSVLVGALVLLVGQGVGHQVWLGTLIFLTGTGTGTGTVATSAVTSMSALAASFYPTRACATGVAWMLGIGRIGGVAGALVGAALMGLGWKFGAVFSLLAVAAVVPASGVYLMMRRVLHKDAPEDAQDDASTDEAAGTVALK